MKCQTWELVQGYERTKYCGGEVFSLTSPGYNPHKQEGSILQQTLSLFSVCIHEYLFCEMITLQR